MRQNAARFVNLALVAGLLLVVGVASPGLAGAATTTQKPWLGVSMQELTSDLSEGLDYNGPGGVIVSRVVPGSPAEKAGLERDDVIVRFNGRTVEDPEELTNEVAAAAVGQRVSVQVFREGALRTIGVTLGARPRTGSAWSDEPETLEAPEAPDAPDAPNAPEIPSLPAKPKRIERSFVLGPDDLQGLGQLGQLGRPGNGAFLLMAGRARLGVRVEPLSPVLGEYFGLKDGKGALVLEVLKGRPAEKAGLLPGDVITRVDDRAVANSRDLVEALRGKEGKVAMRVVRHGTPRTIEATLDRVDSTWVEEPETGSSEGPAVQKRIVVRMKDRQDLRHELDQLKQELDDLREQLEQQQGDEGDE
jgi:predicted metalloprotease with PDZ domain